MSAGWEDILFVQSPRLGIVRTRCFAIAAGQRDMDRIETVEHGARFMVDARAGAHQRSAVTIRTLVAVVEARAPKVDVSKNRIWHQYGPVDLAAYLQRKLIQERRI